MKALVYGVRPEHVEVGDGANTLTANLARTPTAMRDVPDPQLLQPRLGDHPTAADRHLRVGLQADPDGFR